MERFVNWVDTDVRLYCNIIWPREDILNMDLLGSVTSLHVKAPVSLRSVLPLGMDIISSWSWSDIHKTVQIISWPLWFLACSCLFDVLTSNKDIVSYFGLLVVLVTLFPILLRFPPWTWILSLTIISTDQHQRDTYRTCHHDCLCLMLVTWSS